MGKDKKLKKLWETRAQFETKEGYQTISRLEFLEKEGVVFVGAGSNEIMAYKIDTGTKICSFYASGLSRKNYMEFIASSEKFSIFVAAA